MRLGPKEYGGRGGVALIRFLSLLFQSISGSILISECSDHRLCDCIKFSALL